MVNVCQGGTRHLQQLRSECKSRHKHELGAYSYMRCIMMQSPPCYGHMGHLSALYGTGDFPFS